MPLPRSPFASARRSCGAVLLFACATPAIALDKYCPDNVSQELAAVSGQLPDAPIIDAGSARARIRELAASQAGSCEAALRGALAHMRETADREGAGVIEEGRSVAKALKGYPEFKFQPGDVILLQRDAAPISVAVSQIAEQKGFFAHAAIVGYNPEKKNKLYVIETALGDGLQVESLKDWTDTRFARFAVYRPRDQELALRAATAAYTDAEGRKDGEKAYDVAMALRDPSLLYCSEVVTNAYRLAAPDAPLVPVRLSSVGSLIETFPMSTLGAAERYVFLPDDIELDGRFDPVIELRVPALIAKSEPLERIIRNLYEGLRGPQREQILADIDRQEPGASKALASLFGGRYPAFSNLPKDALPRMTGFGRIVAAQLESERQQAKTAAAEAKK